MVLLHGISATRRYVVHGSKALARAAFISSPTTPAGTVAPIPAPPEAGYSYPELVADLEAVVDAEVGERPFLLGGHSMGAHTAVAYAIEHRRRLAGPRPDRPRLHGLRRRRGSRSAGIAWPTGSSAEESTASWRRSTAGSTPSGGTTVLRFTRQRMQRAPPPGGGRTRAPRGTALDSRSTPCRSSSSSTSRRWWWRVATTAIPDIPYAVAAAYAESLPGRAPGHRGGGRLPAGLAGRAARARDRRVRATSAAVAARLGGDGPGPLLCFSSR